MQVQIYYIFYEVQNKIEEIMKKRFDEVSARVLDELETRGISGYRMMKDKVMKSQASLTA